MFFISLICEYKKENKDLSSQVDTRWRSIPRPTVGLDLSTQEQQRTNISKYQLKGFYFGE